MTPLLALSIAITGGLGASARYVIDIAVQRRFKRTGPLGILVVNVSASLLAGLAAGFGISAGAEFMDASLRLTLLIGFLGGYSTFSTVAVDTVLLARERRHGWVAMNTLGMLVLSVAAVLLGLTLGSLAAV